jgi:peptide chain release factor 1
MTDHRISLTLYSLDRIMDGDIAVLMDSLHKNDIEERIAAKTNSNISEK